MELASLLDEAKRATPATRIAWRDRIAAHGERAIEAMKPWLREPSRAAFAVRVVERAGAGGPDAGVAARDVLRAARSTAPAIIRSDIDWALRHLRELSQPVPPAAAHSKLTRGPARPLRRSEPHLRTVIRRRHGDRPLANGQPRTITPL